MNRPCPVLLFTSQTGYGGNVEKFAVTMVNRQPWAGGRSSGRHSTKTTATVVLDCRSEERGEFRDALHHPQTISPRGGNERSAQAGNCSGLYRVAVASVDMKDFSQSEFFRENALCLLDRYRLSHI